MELREMQEFEVGKNLIGIYKEKVKSSEEGDLVFKIGNMEIYMEKKYHVRHYDFKIILDDEVITHRGTITDSLKLAFQKRGELKKGVS